MRIYWENPSEKSILTEYTFENEFIILQNSKWYIYFIEIINYNKINENIWNDFISFWIINKYNKEIWLIIILIYNYFIY